MTEGPAEGGTPPESNAQQPSPSAGDASAGGPPPRWQQGATPGTPPPGTPPGTPPPGWQGGWPAPPPGWSPGQGPGWQAGSEQWPGAGFNAGTSAGGFGSPGAYGSAGPYGSAGGYGAGGPAGPGGPGAPGAPGQYPGYGYPGYARPLGPPWIVGDGVDKVLGFLVGAFFNVMGMVGTIVLMYMWAGTNSGPRDAADRREHAKSVSIWSTIGCFIPVVFFVAILILGIGVFAVHGTSGDFPYQPIPISTFP